ncbi:nicotinamide riboside transporter PnuC [Parafilimonas sp.]|uniref:nicotinamide riboside transporter PnuC n=1 Tax=Parafilimonas sp. TaxID=1969739 RepID=UPI0039E70526
MRMHDWIYVFWQQVKQTGWLEWLGVSFGVAEVLFAKANKLWLYPTGIISVVITICLFYTAGLYAESALNIYYLIMSIWGWWLWIHRSNKPPLPITKSNAKDRKITAVIVVVSFILLYFVLKNFTDSRVPLFDAWVSAAAWAGMWLLAKRKLENWVLLNISNAFAIPLLFYKQLPLYALLTAFLFVIAIQGYFKWKKIINEEQSL